MVTVILLSIWIIFVSQFLMIYHRLPTRHLFLLKIIASFGFFAVGVSAFLENPNQIAIYFSYLLTGLVFGLLGDIGLGLKEIFPSQRQSWMAIGGFSFLIGHLFYIIVLYNIASYALYVILPIAVVLSFFGFLLNHYVLHLQLGKMKAIILLYTFISSVLLVLGIGNVLFDYSIVSLMLGIAVVLFVVSDYLLAILYFKKTEIKQRKAIKIINLSLYYIAQYIIAMVLFIG